MSYENKGKTCKAHVVSTQEVVRCEIWTRGLQKRHSYKQQSP